ncbi:MAG: hypothetical protein U0401_27890 [Anaerolineae bacterium]
MRWWAQRYGIEASFDMNTILPDRTIRGVSPGTVCLISIPKLIELYLTGHFPFDRLINLSLRPDQPGHCRLREQATPSNLSYGFKILKKYAEEYWLWVTNDTQVSW